MLVSLYVKNLALIDAVELEFQEGLNILSGETGAGKSVIIGSVNLALGAKAEKEMIREGAEYALIELCFQTEDEQVAKCLENMDLPVSEDGSILISRKIQPNRSSFKVNGETVTARQVKTLAEYLLDIHGQHEHQSLLKKKKHMEILDGYAGTKLEILLDEYKALFAAYGKKKQELEEASMDEESRLRESELASFEIEEIRMAEVSTGEDEKLEKDYQKMLHGRNILERANIVSEIVSSEQDGSAGDLIGKALREINSVLSYDEEVQVFSQQLTEIDDLLHGFHRDLNDYMERMDFSEEQFHMVESRLNVLNHLKAKYGKTLEDVLDYYEKRCQEYDNLLHYDSYLEQLRRDLKNMEDRLLELGKEISGLRKASATELSEKMQKALLDLNFMQVEFEVHVTSDPEHMTSDGLDDVEFLISMNPGQPMRPLHMIASGGELSRIMLGLKTVIADKDAIETLIFDEIDAGISGKTAWKVSEKLGELSKNHQIICITHLPQIAAMADTHFRIEKIVENESTKTMIQELDGKNHIKEIARMVGGDDISEAAILNARELVVQAGKGNLI